MSKPDSKSAEQPTGSPTGDQTPPREDESMDPIEILDAESGVGQSEADPQVATDPLTTIRDERDRLQNQLQRTLADLQNFRKRRAQERAEARRSGIEEFTLDLLPVLDNFHLATEIGAEADEAGDSMQEGLLMVKSLFDKVFERHNIVEIPAVGETFDPSVHEAVGIDPDPSGQAGTVTRVLQKGYSIDGRVVRPSKVMVGGAPNTEGGPADKGSQENSD